MPFVAVAPVAVASEAFVVVLVAHGIADIVDIAESIAVVVAAAIAVSVVAVASVEVTAIAVYAVVVNLADVSGASHLSAGIYLLRKIHPVSSISFPTVRCLPQT